ncbi:hypothetical protein CP083_07145 [Candidatus Bathyarchaeota archaeon B24-2]|nr:MAG: hypothetical protein CP083_07145 [Candidatus Bathyarchaeota archaeon B24-2]
MKGRQDRLCEEVLRSIGIKKGFVVLDFGCGSGNYTIPAARIVGEEGVVYALDKDEEALDELMRRAESEGLNNVRRIDTKGEVNLKLDDESVDVVLLYDIFWYFPLSDPRLTRLLKEAYRVLRGSGLLSVLPKHIDPERLREKIEGIGFRLRSVYSGAVLHDGVIEKGQILNFMKA